MMASLMTKALISTCIGDGVISKGLPIDVKCVQCFTMFEAREGYLTIKGTRKPDIICPKCREMEQRQFWEKWRTEIKLE
jgi:hypothetical protein